MTTAIIASQNQSKSNKEQREEATRNAERQIEQAKREARQTIKAAGRWVCPWCETSNRATAHFCRTCGAEALEWECANCRTRNINDTCDFCEKPFGKGDTIMAGSVPKNMSPATKREKLLGDQLFILFAIAFLGGIFAILLYMVIKNPLSLINPAIWILLPLSAFLTLAMVQVLFTESKSRAKKNEEWTEKYNYVKSFMDKKE